MCLCNAMKTIGNRDVHELRALPKITMYPSMRRTTRDNLELHYARHTSLSSLCAFWQKEFCILLPPSLRHLHRQTNEQKKRHFIINLLGGIFSAIFFYFTIYIFKKNCVFDTSGVSPWPSFSILAIVRHGTTVVIPSLALAPLLCVWNVSKNRIQSKIVSNSRNWSRLSTLVTTLNERKSRITCFVHFSPSSLPQMACRLYHWRHF